MFTALFKALKGEDNLTLMRPLWIDFKNESSVPVYAHA